MSVRLKYILIASLSLLLFVPFLGQVHLFDWDEINFAECAREMIVTKDYLRMQVDFKPFYEKPPLFIWLQVLSMKVFGINEFAARFPNAMAGVATLLALFYIAKKVVNEKIGFYWVMLYCITWLPHFYFKTGIIDPIFNLFIFLAVYQVYLLKYSQKKWLQVLLAGVFVGLAVLTKGPVAIIVSLLCFLIFAIMQRGIEGYKISQLLAVALIALCLPSIWFGIEIVKNGTTFLNEFISYQAGLFSQNIADHAEPWFYHPIVLFIGCFPASLFLFQYSFRQKGGQDKEAIFGRWMWILFWVVLILFSIVKTKIVHYSSLCYFPITYLAAVQVYRLQEQQYKLKKLVQGLLLFVATVWGLLLTMLPLVGIYKAKIIPYIQDPFAAANLQADVHWRMAECGFGLSYLLLTWFSILLLRRNFRKGIFILAIVQLLMIQITMLHFTPKIEAYSQRAAIDFYESKKGQDVYIKVLEFHSYAYLFYAQKQSINHSNYYKKEWLLTGEVDKPTFFVCKIQDAEPYKSLTTLRVLYEKNGFVFFERITP